MLSHNQAGRGGPGDGRDEVQVTERGGEGGGGTLTISLEILKTLLADV